MLSFEILCTTMGQKNFNKIQKMNIHSDVVFSNQDGRNYYEETEFENHVARMITTDTIGVGKNRNIGLTYAKADICLFADDDIKYADNCESLILKEFEQHPDADIIIFNMDTDDRQRKQRMYQETKKCGFFFMMPWATFRIAFRLSSVRNANLWFSTLFGGGCVFPSGEDSMWLNEAKKSGLTFYVSKEVIGKVSFEKSTWFTGYDEKFYYAKGAYYTAVHPKSLFVWMVYFAFRTRSFCKMTFKEKIKWMSCGRHGYKNMMSYDDYLNHIK